MGEFFRSWHRKVGCVTLVMACLFTAGWIRSNEYREIVVLKRRNITSQIESRRGFLAFIHCVDVSNLTFRPAIQELISISSRRNEDYWRDDPLDDSEFLINSQYRFLARVARGQAVRHPIQHRGVQQRPFVISNFTGLTLPYGAIIAPLSLLSITLLIGRQAIPKSKVQPIDCLAFVMTVVSMGLSIALVNAYHEGESLRIENRQLKAEAENRRHELRFQKMFDENFPYRQVTPPTTFFDLEDSHKSF
jgi:hypothetical protein